MTVHTTPVRNGSLLTLASFVVLVAGIKSAATLVVPFLLASFLAIICTPGLYWMKNKGVPSIVAIILLISVVVGLVSIIGTLIGSSLADFSKNVPEYQEKLKVVTESAWSWLTVKGLVPETNFLDDIINPGKIMRLAANTLNGLGGMVTNTFLIFLTFIFILTEASGIPTKISAIQGSAGSLNQYSQITSGVNRYLVIKLMTSSITGLIITAWLSVQGVDYAVMWGVFALLLNFIPNIGSIIAAIPALLLSLIQLGPSAAVVTSIGFLSVNILIGSVIEPKIMGRDMGLSTLVVFLSLTFWGWVLGPVGMLLSVPLTMAAKIILEDREDTKWVAILLGSNREASEILKKEVS